MYFLNDTIYFVECCGVIAAWEFMPLQQGWIHFMIWRKNLQDIFYLVGKNTFLVTSKCKIINHDNNVQKNIFYDFLLDNLKTILSILK